MGRKGLHKTVHNLAEWGVLVPVGSTPRGSSIFGLGPSWSKELDAALRRSTSSLAADQRLVLLTHPDLSEAARCLAREHPDDLAWVGVLGQREGLVFGVQDSADRVVEMRKSLDDAGVECELKAIGHEAFGDEVAPFLRGFGAEDPEADSA